jgi:hypothetical protein
MAALLALLRRVAALRDERRVRTGGGPAQRAGSGGA